MASNAQRTKLELVEEHPQIVAEAALALCQQRDWFLQDKELARVGIRLHVHVHEYKPEPNYPLWQATLGNYGGIARSAEPGRVIGFGFGREQFEAVLESQGWTRKLPSGSLGPPEELCRGCKHLLRCTLSGNLL